MEVILIYFSQTGNTQSVALAMSDAFQRAGHASRAINLRRTSVEDAIRCDLLGIGTACISSKAPTPVKLFLQSLPFIKGQDAFVFATSGGAPGRVLSEMSKLLRNKGANVLGGFLTRGHVTHPAPHMFDRFPERPNPIDLERAHQFVHEISDLVTTGRSKPLLQKRYEELISDWGFYSFLGFISSDRVVRLILPEPRPDQNSCDKCQLCADECPMENITMNPFPMIGNLCIRCFRCFNVCPQKAFNVNWNFADPFLWVLYNTIFIRWFGDLVPGEQIYPREISPSL